MRLHPELQTLVCRSLTKSELKVARLVCKSLDQAAVPLLFNEIFVAASYSDLDIADSIASNFGSYVKEITISIVEYDPLPKEEFCGSTRAGRKDSLERINDHRKHAFDTYCKARSENLEIMESGELLAKICVILSKSLNIRKMILTDCGNNDIYNLYEPHPHDPWEKALCPFPECKLSVSEHISFHIRPRAPWTSKPNPLHLAMLAISAAKSFITELEILHEGEDPFITKDSFFMTARQSCHLTLPFQHLAKLRMRFGKFQAQDSHPDRVISKALSVAVNLESLFIEGDEPISELGFSNLTLMSSVLGDCRYPKLRSLILKYIDSRENELLDFLMASPHLKNLTLEWFELIDGSWEVVVERIRSALRLKSVMLHRLCDGFPDFAIGLNRIDCNDQDTFTNDHLLVENFFLQNGENPFTESAINMWYDKDLTTRWEMNKDLDCEQRYHMFH